jgi:hypothetical protein
VLINGLNVNGGDAGRGNADAGEPSGCGGESGYAARRAARLGRAHAGDVHHVCGCAHALGLRACVHVRAARKRAAIIRMPLVHPRRKGAPKVHHAALVPKA